MAKQFKVSNMKTLSDGIELRILSEKSPHYNAKEETMTWRTYSYIISERKQVMIMTYYEIKKFFKKRK